MPQFSVIVPVYNVERYLVTCVNSVLEQSFTDIELILIDDGSTDNSGALCDAYSMQDPRVHTIHQANGGLGEARNTGILAAAGEWILFLDSDDYWERDALSRIAEKMQQWPECPLYVCRWKKFSESEQNQLGVPIGVEVEGPKSFSSLREQIMYYQKNCDWAVWKLVISRAILQEPKLLFLQDVRNGEDLYWIIHLFQRTNTLCFLNVVICNYRVREKGTLSEESAENAFRWMESIYITLQQFKKESVKEKQFVLSWIADKYVLQMIIAAQRENKKRWMKQMPYHMEVIKNLYFFDASPKGKLCLIGAKFGKWILWNYCSFCRKIRKLIISIL